MQVPGHQHKLLRKQNETVNINMRSLDINITFQDNTIRYPDIKVSCRDIGSKSLDIIRSPHITIRCQEIK